MPYSLFGAATDATDATDVGGVLFFARQTKNNTAPMMPSSTSPPTAAPIAMPSVESSSAAEGRSKTAADENIEEDIEDIRLVLDVLDVLDVLLRALT